MHKHDAQFTMPNGEPIRSGASLLSIAHCEFYVPVSDAITRRRTSDFGSMVMPSRTFVM